MSDTIRSLQKQLAEAQQNLRLIQERKAEYVLETDVPLHIVKGERSLEVQIADLRERLEVCQEPLTQLYERLQGAAARKDWAEVLALARRIHALDADYRDVPQLVAQARERLQQPQRRPMPTWTRWAAGGGAILVLLLGLGLALGPRLFGATSAPTEAPTKGPIAITQGILVQEDFGSNVGGWGEGEYSGECLTGEDRIVDGKLRMSAEWRKFWIRWKDVPGFTGKDFLLSVDAVIVEASDNDRTRVVMTFREKDFSNTYIAKFSNAGVWQIGLWQNDEWKVIRDWEVSDAIKLDEGVDNTLGILVKGPRFTIYANGQELA